LKYEKITPGVNDNVGRTVVSEATSKVKYIGDFVAIKNWEMDEN
jgi:hypothetical protein